MEKRVIAIILTFTIGISTLFGCGSKAGEEVDNIHVEFVNADSGEVISSGDSKDMKS